MDAPTDINTYNLIIFFDVVLIEAVLQCKTQMKLRCVCLIFLQYWLFLFLLFYSVFSAEAT